MKKYILVAHEDKSNPYAVEAKLHFTSKNGDENMVVIINVPHAKYIAPGLLQVKSHIANGTTKTTKEGAGLVTKLAKLANDKQHRLSVYGKLVKFVARNLGLSNLSCEKCMIVCE